MGFIGLKAFPAAVVGGFGSVPGALVGGLIIGIVEALAGFYLPDGFKDVAAYIVVLVVLLVRPSGMFGETAQEGVSRDALHLQDRLRRRTSACSSTADRCSGTACSASLLLAAPFIVSGYVLSQLQFIFIYAIVGLGLMLLVGYTGQISLGHAAFLGDRRLYRGAAAGAPACRSSCRSSARRCLSAAVGVIVGLPALRMNGIYLAIATLAFGVIVEEIFTRWESVTGGNGGKLLKAIEIFGWRLSSPESFYYLCLALTVLACLALINLLRSPTGRALVAIRDSEVSAQCMGINLALLQDDVVRALGGADRARRRAVRPQGRLHLARAVHAPAVDRAGARS